MMELSVGRIVGKHTESGWSQVGVFSGEGYEKLILVFSMMGVTREVVRTVKAALEQLTSGFFSNDDGDIDRLKRLILEMGKLVDGNKVRVVAGLIKGGELVMGAHGRASVMIKRGERIGWLLGNDSQEGVRVVKGKLERGDRLVLGVNDFFDLVSDQKLKEALSRNDLQEASEVLVGVVNESESVGSAGMVVEFWEHGEFNVVDDDLEPERPKAKAGIGLVGKDLIKKLLGRRLTSKIIRLRAARMGRRAPDVYLPGQKKKKLTGSVAIVLLLLLGVSVFMGWRKRVADDRAGQLAAIYEPAVANFDEAQSLVETNPLRARAMLNELKNEVEAALVLFDEGSQERRSLQELLSRVEELYEMIAGEVEIEQATDFYDLKLVRDDLFGSQMGLVDNQLVVLDVSHGLVVKVETGSKQAEIIGGGEAMGGASLMAVNVGRAVVLSDRGIVAVWFDLDREPELLVETEDDWEDPIQVGAFGGNVYLLDVGSGELWRYPGFDGGVGDRIRWLGPGVVPDFSGVVDMAIDGDIWTLSKGGEIDRYRQGAPLSFSISGLAGEITEAVAIGVSEEGNGVYVLDRGNRRVVVLNKDGEYMKQYLWEGIAGVSDMVVEENEDGGGRILLLSGADIYEIALQE